MALVALESGHRLFTNVVDCEAEAIHIGMAVTASFVETTDGEMGLVVFRPQRG